MRKKIAIISLLVMLFVLMIHPSVWAEEAGQEQEIILIINHYPYVFQQEDARPLLENDRVYVPLRVVVNALSCKIHWNGDTYQIFISTTDHEITTTDILNPAFEKPQILIDGKVLELDAFMGEPFINADGYTMLPLRAVSEALDCKVTWQDGVVIINKNEPEPEILPVVNEVIAPEYKITIMGESQATIQQMQAWLDYMEPFLRKKAEDNGTEFHEYPLDIAELYWKIGNQYGVRGDIAFAQALKETGYFQYGGIVESWQNNFCGLGATGTAYTAEDALLGTGCAEALILEGTHGVTFTSVSAGVEAHIQHLYAYATDKDLPGWAEQIDPRFEHKYRNSAGMWVELNGKWAVPGDGYGQSILDDYWRKILSYQIK